MVKPGSQTSSVTGPIYLTPAHDTSHDAPSSFPLAEHGGIRSCARNDIHGPHEYDAMPSHKDEFMHWSCPGLRGSEAKIFPMEEVMASDGPATGKPPGHDVPTPAEKREHRVKLRNGRSLLVLDATHFDDDGKHITFWDGGREVDKLQTQAVEYVHSAPVVSSACDACGGAPGHLPGCPKSIAGNAPAVERGT